MITEDMIEAVWKANGGSPICRKEINKVLKVVEPILIAQGLREAYMLQAYKGKTGRDAFLARAQELDPK